MDPPTLKAIFNSDEYTAALSSAGRYEAAGNIWWLSPYYSPTPGVPLSRPAIESLRKYFFGRSGSAERFIFPFPLTVAAEQGVNPLESRGSLKRVSPEEIVAAFFLQVADEIRNAAPIEDLQRPACTLWIAPLSQSTPPPSHSSSLPRRMQSWFGLSGGETRC